MRGVSSEEEKEGYSGKDLQKKAWNKRVRGDGILIITSINVSIITTV